MILSQLKLVEHRGKYGALITIIVNTIIILDHIFIAISPYHPQHLRYSWTKANIASHLGSSHTMWRSSSSLIYCNTLVFIFCCVVICLVFTQFPILQFCTFATLQFCRHVLLLFPQRTGLLFRLWGNGGRRLVGTFFYSEWGSDSHDNHHHHCCYRHHQLLNFEHSQVEDECGDIPMVLVQNKIDLISQSEINQWVSDDSFKVK